MNPHQNPPRPPRYVPTLADVDSLLDKLWLFACPSCARVGSLIGHGRIFRYVGSSPSRCEVGRRFYCSKRGRRQGCGRTWATYVHDVFARFMIAVTVFFDMLLFHSDGSTWRQAWISKSLNQTSLRNSYRIWHRFRLRYSGLRTRLSAICQEPKSAPVGLLTHLLVHFENAFPNGACHFLEFHLHEQVSIL